MWAIGYRHVAPLGYRWAIGYRHVAPGAGGAMYSAVWNAISDRLKMGHFSFN
jgi:hypothetical protein